MSVGAGSLCGMTDPAGTRYWVVSTSLDHVLRGVAGGFTRADAGRETRLRRPARGDRVVFYSPRAGPGSTRALQQLTALGVIADDEPYRAGDPAAAAWHRRVDYEDVRAVPIRPLLPMLGFVTDEQRWGLPFRSGLLEVTAGDFGVLAGALRDAASMDDVFSTSGRRAGA